MGRKLEYFAIGLIIGAVGGVVIGLLFAPDSGARTRRRIANEALRVADVARGIAERAEQTAEVVGERVDHYLGRDEQVAWRKVRELREGVQRYSRTVMSS
ncbi:MAG: YtxH domain-containing protein [Anaerosomatales bacterium]|nr:YtxH domain-containing protein [Anaerosomatales bacterium]